MGEASLFDGLLALALLITALRAFWAKGSFEAVFSLLFFGFFMAMAWMRLGAADIALVEAAIGAGLTAAILMEVLRVSGSSSFSPYGYWVLPIGALLGGVGTLILGTLPDRAATSGAYALAQDALQSTPIGNPVTAVLLDFRGYDTLLEVGVLLLAAFAVTTLSGPIADRFEQQRTMLSFLSHYLAPIVVLVAGYLLYQGMDASGGAFQASALLAAAGVLFTLSGHPRARHEAVRTRTGLMTAGFVIFFLIGIVLALLEGHFLAYPTRWQPALIFTIEVALTFSLAYALLMFYWRIAHSGQAR